MFDGSGAPFAGRSLAQIDFGYQYTSAAVIPDGGPDADPPGADYTPTAAPGCRAPHLWLPDGRSTIDLFDTGFVVLSGEPLPAVPLENHVLKGPEWAELSGVGPAGKVLVRPDGHVAWRGEGDVTRALAAVLGR